MQFLGVIQNDSIIYGFINDCVSKANRSVKEEGDYSKSQFSTPEFKTECVPMRRSNRYLSYYVVIDKGTLTQHTLWKILVNTYACETVIISNIIFFKLLIVFSFCKHNECNFGCYNVPGTQRITD